MFSVQIGETKIVFAKFFAETDRTSCLAAIPGGTRRVVFIDTPATPHLVGLVEDLLERDIVVVIRDHHDEPNPRNQRGEEIKAAAARLRELCGDNTRISNRQATPACSGLIEAGEYQFEDGTVIVADPDPDGLLGAMKAAGVTYPGLDQDADVLDGPRAAQTADRLTPTALLLVRGMSTLPAFDSARPDVSEKAKAELFSSFVEVVKGNVEARARLEKSALAYEEGVAEAQRLAGTVSDLMPGVAFVDLTSASRFDLTTLAGKMEARPGTKVTVQRKAAGPIAGAQSKAGRPAVQFSLAVVKAFQAEINLQEFLPAGFVSSPETGIISNTTFLLHVSESVWNETVRPALERRFGHFEGIPRWGFTFTG